MYARQPSSLEARIVRKRVMQAALRTRPHKYLAFFAGMYAARSFATAAQMDVLLNTYAGMRRVDDVVDGDAELPARYATREDYVLGRIRCLESGRIEDGADLLLHEARHAAQRLGFNLDEECLNMLGSMLFDSRRVRTGQIFSAQELDSHFSMLDIEGTIRGTLKIAGEDVALYEQIEPLGVASRIYYNLRDLREDLEAGFVNLPAEFFAKSGRGGSAMRDSGFLRQWSYEEARRGMQILDRRGPPYEGLRRSTNAVLSLLYEIPAEAHFRRVLARGPGQHDKP